MRKKLGIIQSTIRYSKEVFLSLGDLDPERGKIVKSLEKLEFGVVTKVEAIHSQISLFICTEKKLIPPSEYVKCGISWGARLVKSILKRDVDVMFEKVKSQNPNVK